MVESDSALLVAACGGDERAFATLCARYEEGARAAIARRLGPHVRRRVSIADVLQESWMVAHRRLGKFEHRGDGAFGRWITAIADRKALDEIKRHIQAQKRSAHAEATGAGKPPTGELPGSGPTPSQVAMAAETREQARRAVAKLKPAQREALFLIQKEHLTLQQAADRMGRSRDSIKGLYSRALKALAKALSQEGEQIT